MYMMIFIKKKYTRYAVIFLYNIYVLFNIVIEKENVQEFKRVVHGLPK
jgi:hypothetical protein